MLSKQFRATYQDIYTPKLDMAYNRKHHHFNLTPGNIECVYSSRKTGLCLTVLETWAAKCEPSAPISGPGDLLF